MLGRADPDAIESMNIEVGRKERRHEKGAALADHP